MSETPRTSLLARIDAWLTSPLNQEETGTLLLDIAETLEREHFVDQVQVEPTQIPQQLRNALAVIQRHPGIGGAELGTALEISPTYTHTLIHRLTLRGLINKKHGRAGRGGITVHLYAVTP